MWEINVGDQFATFLYSLALGGMLCLIYDILRAARKVGLDSTAAVFISDILFWIFSAFLVFIFLIARTNGEVRGYVLFSCLIGFVIFRLTLSKLSFAVFKYILGILSLILNKISVFSAYLIGKSEEILSKASQIAVKNFKSIGKIVKKVLKSVRVMLYTKKNDNLERTCDEN